MIVSANLISGAVAGGPGVQLRHRPLRLGPALAEGGHTTELPHQLRVQLNTHRLPERQGFGHQRPRGFRYFYGKFIAL